MTLDEANALKPGDRVVFKSQGLSARGQVRSVNSYGGNPYLNAILVCFDERFVCGHEGDGTLPSGHGYWFTRSELEFWSHDVTLREQLRHLWSGALT